MFLSQYVDLKISKKKEKFTALEKQKITNSAKALVREGVIFFDEVENKYYPLVKFAKTRKKEKVTGIKTPLLGQFIRGANPNDKMRGTTILKQNHEKIFIPLDLTFLEEYSADGEIYNEEDIENFVYHYFKDDVTAPKLLKADYFSIVTINGWEIGRGNYKGRKAKPATLAKKQATLEKRYARINKSAEGQAGQNKKLRTISRDIADIVIRIFNKNTQRYKFGVETISGLYLYKFTNQRKPNKKEKKVLKRKRKKK